MRPTQLLQQDLVKRDLTKLQYLLGAPSLVTNVRLANDRVGLATPITHELLGNADIRMATQIRLLLVTHAWITNPEQPQDTLTMSQAADSEQN